MVATMGQTDLSLADKMNLRQNAVIANQCGAWGFETRQADFGTFQMVSSDTRGVGINRNLALQLATADILLFADDDIRYYDSDLQGVIDAFRQLPDADVIFFAIDMTRDGKVFDRRRNRVKRLHLHTAMKFGACRMAVRRASIEKARISFSKLFGGGCIYGSGEDSVFIRDCLRAGLKLYSHDYVLGACAKDSSTWFTGYNEKYFYDRGALLACAYPWLKHLMKWRVVFKMRKKANCPLKDVVRQLNAGIRGFKTLKPYGNE